MDFAGGWRGRSLEAPAWWQGVLSAQFRSCFRSCFGSILWAEISVGDRLQIDAVDSNYFSPNVAAGDLHARYPDDSSRGNILHTEK